ncbi:putative sterigmatocystin biosynthesis P450 monooxygenase STCB [Ceratocystis lukuohia]|uniref:Sterigmatocystin biosynthesis P450 monooxygenase STCB n=1 Tax=Ceratocystis lukuohia TaxID=2019550 RepID=A0ABR4MDR1_9PEZI
MAIFSPAILFGLGVVLLVARLLRRAFSPLKSIPGPFYTRLSRMPLRYHEMNANRTLWIHGLHQKYGPVVRIAPNEVAFTSPAAMKEIYNNGGSGYDKTEFYDLFKAYGRRTMFTSLVKNEHSKRRRIIADRYANSNVMRPASMSGINDRAQDFMSKCWDSASGGSIDIFRNLHAYACDCVTQHLFHPFGTRALKDKHDEEMMHQVAVDDSLRNRLIEHYSPTIHSVMSKFLGYFGVRPRDTPLADAFVLDASGQTSTAQFTLMTRMREKIGDLEQLDLAAEALDHMAAGIDTTGDVLCFLMWELSQPHSIHVQKLLQKELRDKPKASFDELPYLDAVINEGLRCFPAIPMSLPRYVPSGGRTIDGYSLPERTIVSCQAYSVHRLNPRIFPDGDCFAPKRWLAAEGDADRRRLQFAFSVGGRGCIGKHLAMAEMKTLIRNVYSTFNTLPDPSMKPESMAMSDQLISSRPLGQRCLLRFEPIEKETL